MSAALCRHVSGARFRSARSRGHQRPGTLAPRQAFLPPCPGRIPASPALSKAHNFPRRHACVGLLQIGITPMIGKNDVETEIFDQAAARQVCCTC